MISTGIVRRIDDLGRVVIPKEIRRALNIKEGDLLEIGRSADGEILMRKYSQTDEIGEAVSALLDLIHMDRPLFTTIEYDMFIRLLEMIKKHHPSDDDEKEDE